jgi:hypothetical protein
MSVDDPFERLRNATQTVSANKPAETPSKVPGLSISALFAKKAEETAKRSPAEITQAIAITDFNFAAKAIKYDAPETTPAESLRKALETLEAQIDNIDVVRQNTDYIISLCRRHPNLRQEMYPEDLGLMVRAISKFMQNAQFKSSQKSTKTSIANKKKHDVTSAIDSAFATAFGAIGAPKK